MARRLRTTTPIVEKHDEANLSFRYRVDGTGSRTFSAELTLTCTGGTGSAETNATCGTESDSDSVPTACAV